MKLWLHPIVTPEEPMTFCDEGEGMSNLAERLRNPATTAICTDEAADRLDFLEVENERLRAELKCEAERLADCRWQVDAQEAENERLTAALRSIETELLPAEQTNWLSSSGKRIMMIARDAMEGKENELS